MSNHNFWKNGANLGLFFAILFIACFIWFYVRGGSPALQQFHQNSLSLAFLGWSGMNLSSFILGLIQSFIWGFIALALWNLSKTIARK